MWDTVKLRDLCDIQSGLWKGKKEPFTKALVLRNTNFTAAGKFDYSNVVELEVETKQLSKREVIKNDIILEKSGGGDKTPVGRVCIHDAESNTPFSLSNFTARIRVIDKQQLDAQFLHRFLFFLYMSGKTEPMQRHSTGIRNLQLAQYKEIDVPLPPLAQQKRIVAKLDAAFAEIDRAIEVAESKHTEVEKLKAALLSSMLRGEDWETVKLGEACTRITDGSHNPPKGIESSNYLMLSSKNVFDDEINFEKPRYLSKNDFAQENKRTDVQQGDVLLTIVGTIGRCAVVDSLSRPFTLQRSVAVLKPKRELVNSRFLMYKLQGMLNELTSGARGVAQKGIYLKSLKQLSMTIPQLTQQQRIVAKLDAAFAELDRAKTSVLDTKAHYQALKSAILAKELTPPQIEAA